jgi:hypothetical protein
MHHRQAPHRVRNYNALPLRKLAAADKRFAVGVGV